MNKTGFLYLGMLGVFVSVGVTLAIQEVVQEVDADRLANADGSDGEWLTVGLNYHENRYSPLDQITADNVDDLDLVWSAPLADPAGRQESTPLMHDGVLYAITNWSVTIAWDAVTGQELWRYDPEVDRSISQPGTSRLCCGVVNRGIGIYEGRIFVPIIDGRIAALDAGTGEEIWSILAVPADSTSYSLTIAPRIVKGNVIVGFAGAEFPPFRGYFSAYDTDTGDEVWRFWTVPGNPADGFENEAMERAAETWTGNWWEYGGGGSLWDAIAYDPETNLVYVGIGNPTPWPQEIRQGVDTPRLDNLYVSSILAVDADTGEYAWHYQTTPGGDDWDYDAVQHLILADVEIQGRDRRVIMQANKNGVFYVLDRTTGAFISAEPFAEVSWMFGYDYETGRPNINSDAYYSTDQPVTVSPSAGGAHSWAQMAYNPNTGLVYMPINARGAFTFTTTPEFEFTPGNQNLGLNLPGFGGPPPDPNATPPEPRTLPVIGPDREIEGRGGILSAWNPVTQSEAWFSNGGAPSGGGVLTTASNLVLQMLNDGTLRALDAETGELIADVEFGQNNMGPPMTYMIDGVQYIAALGGGGGRGGGGAPMIYVFAVDGGQ
jgi:PQQ-dependent dehydrogenase (methanol/ethanol family)